MPWTLWRGLPNCFFFLPFSFLPAEAKYSYFSADYSVWCFCFGMYLVSGRYSTVPAGIKNAWYIAHITSCRNRERLREPQRQWQRRRRQTKLKWAIQWLCTCVINLDTFLCRPLHAKQQHKITKFCVVWSLTWTTTAASFFKFLLQIYRCVPDLVSLQWKTK